jgi:hypothetical protein
MLKLVVAFVFLAGLGFVLSTASCTKLCPADSTAGSGGSGGSGGSTSSAGTSDCSSSSSAGTAGAAPTTCDYLTALEACYATFCQADGAGSPFCSCYTQKLALADDCTCTTIKAASVCQQALNNGLDGTSVDCTAQTAAVATQCVPVQ